MGECVGEGWSSDQGVWERQWDTEGKCESLGTQGREWEWEGVKERGWSYWAPDWFSRYSMWLLDHRVVSSSLTLSAVYLRKKKWG